MRKGGPGDMEEKRGGKRRRAGRKYLKVNNMQGGFLEGGQSRTYGKDIDKDVRFRQLRIYRQK